MVKPYPKTVEQLENAIDEYDGTTTDYAISVVGMTLKEVEAAEPEFGSRSTLLNAILARLKALYEPEQPQQEVAEADAIIERAKADAELIVSAAQQRGDELLAQAEERAMQIETKRKADEHAGRSRSGRRMQWSSDSRYHDEYGAQ